MTEHFRWFDEDARMIQEEADDLIGQQKAYLASEEALSEWDAYIQGLSVEDAETALEGLREYAKAVIQDQDIDMGWHKYL